MKGVPSRSMAIPFSTCKGTTDDAANVAGSATTSLSIMRPFSEMNRYLSLPVAILLTNPVDLLRQLPLGGERRGEDHRTCASDERAPVYHWMTSSARPSRECGMLSPSALAVLRLMTS